MTTKIEIATQVHITWVRPQLSPSSPPIMPAIGTSPIVATILKPCCLPIISGAVSRVRMGTPERCTVLFVLAQVHPRMHQNNRQQRSPSLHLSSSEGSGDTRIK
jgi:hypothetical protein